MHLDDLKRDVALREANLVNRRSLAVADGKRLAAAARAAATPIRIGVVGLATGFLMGRGGPTTAVNLGPLCRTHHNAKTHGRWRVQHDPDTDTLTWTSPLARTYTTSTDPPLQ